MAAKVDRRTYIGGSEAAAVAGVGLWDSPYSVWARKVGEEPPREQSERMRWGTVLEWPVAREWARREGVKNLTRPEFRRMEVHPFIGGHADYLGDHPQDGPVLIEVKISDRASEWSGDEEEDRVPLQYFLQVQHYLLLFGLEVGFLVVLIRGNELRSFRIERDQEVINGLVIAYEDLWLNHVLPGIAPEIDGHEATAEALKRAYPRSEDSEVVADLAGQGMIDLLLAARAEESEAVARKTAAENWIKARMGSVSRMISPRATISWKSNNPSVKTDWQSVAKAYRSLLEVQRRVLVEPGAWDGKSPLLLEDLGVTEDGDPLDTIESIHTNTVPGARPFRVTVKSEE